MHLSASKIFFFIFDLLMTYKKLNKLTTSTFDRGCIIKWTQHIGFLTLAGIATVVEGKHGNDS